MPRSIQRVDLSDEAWNNLVHIARSANYGRVAHFLVACAESDLTFYDARPEHLREATEPHEAAIWYDGSPRYSRTLSGLPTSWLISVAHSHHVRAHARQAISLRGLNPARRIRTMHKPDTIWQLTNAVLEAIGLEYLKPAGILPQFIPVKSRRHVLDKHQIIM